MAISEKTVELNVTRVVVEKIRRTHQICAYSIGFNQAEEALLGLDVDITDGTWTAGFIQYKALHIDPTKPTIHEWKLNQTTRRDQHSLLLTLENANYPVFYCFPQFDGVGPLNSWANTNGSLWKHVWWVRPSSLAVPAPIDVHHEVKHNTVTSLWTIQSTNPQPIERPWIPFDTVLAEMEGKNKPRLGKMKETVKEFLMKRKRDIGARYNPKRDDIFSGLAIFAIGPK